MELRTYGLCLGLSASRWKVLGFGLLIAVVFLGNAGLLFAQGIVTGSVSGFAQDQQGAMVPDASVRAVHVATGAAFAGQSNAQGYFELRGLPIGSYTVIVEAHGFRKVQLSAVGVEAGKNTAVGTHVLELGGTSETIMVEGTAPVVDTATSQVSSTFVTAAVENLPLGGTGFDFLALFVP